MRCKERDRCISPVIDKTPGAILGVKLEYGKKLYRGDSQISEIWNLFDQSAICAPSFLRYARVGMASKSFNVHLVDYGLGGQALQGLVAFPII
jgi:hypothetical protein